MLGISEAAASIGLRATGIRTSMEKLKQQSKLPCIIHWNQEHFVVLYKIEKKRGKTWFYIADPAYGLLKYEEQELKKMLDQYHTRRNRKKELPSCWMLPRNFMKRNP